MTFLPQKTQLGRLKPIEVYSFYDMPALFSCKNTNGHLFLACWIDSDVEPDIDSDDFLYVRLSEKRFEQVGTGEVDLHDAFSQAEDGSVLRVRTLYNCEIETPPSYIVKKILTHVLTEDMLPLTGEKLSVE